MDKNKINLAIFASGNGTNAENIVQYFSENINVQVVATFVNNKNAGVIERMNKLYIPVFLFDTETLYQSDKILEVLVENNIDFIVLAGFLKLIPEKIVEKFQDKIINIHPALLPKYGGKGMFGQKVHEQVIKNNDSVSGITIHTVNKDYDKGVVLFQALCRIEKTDNADTLAAKIHLLEYRYFPQIIEAWLMTNAVHKE